MRKDKNVRVYVDSDGIEQRIGLRSIFIKVADISTMEEFNDSWATRLTLYDGRSFIVDERPEDHLYNIQKRKEESKGSQFLPNLPKDGYHSFDLIRVERQAQSWVGKLFQDAANFFRGDAEILPPIKATHTVDGQKLSRSELRKMYTRDGKLIEP